MSTTSEKFFRLFAFLATFFSDPEELLIEALNGSAIEKKAKRPDEMSRKFTEQFLSMKIYSAFDVNEELHFEFTRESVDSAGVDGSSEDEWKVPLAAYG